MRHYVARRIEERRCCGPLYSSFVSEVIAMLRLVGWDCTVVPCNMSPAATELEVPSEFLDTKVCVRVYYQV